MLGQLRYEVLMGGDETIKNYKLSYQNTMEQNAIFRILFQLDP